MTVLKNRTAIAILFIISMFLFIGFTSKGELLAFINQSFLAGLLCLMIAAGIFVVQGGFFSLFSRTFKKFNKPPGRNWGEEEPDPLSKEERKRFLQNIRFISFIAGIALVLISVLSLFLW